MFGWNEGKSKRELQDEIRLLEKRWNRGDQEYQSLCDNLRDARRISSDLQLQLNVSRKDYRSLSDIATKKDIEKTDKITELRKEICNQNAHIHHLERRLKEQEKKEKEMKSVKNGNPPWKQKGKKDLVNHIYQFEFKYYRQVNGKKTDFYVPIIVHNICYVDACVKVEEHVKKNFADRVDNESTIKYVGEFVGGVLKPFVEPVKKESENPWFDATVLKRAFDNYERYNFIVGVRGSGKMNYEIEKLKHEMKQRQDAEELVWNMNYANKRVQVGTDLFKGGFTHLFGVDVSSMYPSYKTDNEKLVNKRAVDVCEVYRKERDVVMLELEWMKPERVRMKQKIEKLEIKCEGIHKQAKMQKENLRFADNVCADLSEKIRVLEKNHELSVKEIQYLNREKQELISELHLKPLNDFINGGDTEQVARLIKQLESAKELNRILKRENKQLWKEKKG